MNKELEKFKKEVATLFINHTRSRSPYKGYKKWEMELLRMCGYEYNKYSGKWQELTKIVQIEWIIDKDFVWVDGTLEVIDGEKFWIPTEESFDLYGENIYKCLWENCLNLRDCWRYKNEIDI